VAASAEALQERRLTEALDDLLGKAWKAPLRS